MPPGSSETRLPAPFGRGIDRSRTIAFTFEGRTYHGHPGDTVATALFANGVRVMSRSFKYRRPRGLFSLGGFDANTLVQVGPEPNVPADRLPLVEGLPPIVPQNTDGPVAQDKGAVMGLFSRFLPVGFYYRTFFRPLGAWKHFEKIIRSRAGLGRIDPKSPPPPKIRTRHLFCDVAVVGGGVAGIEAARAAAHNGADVILVEAEPVLGGFARVMAPDVFPDLAADIADLDAANIRVLTGTVAQGLFADGFLAAESRTDLFKIRSSAVVLATGIAEQPIVFRNNDLPGIMTAGTVRRLLHVHGIRPGTRAVVCTADDSGWRAAADLKAAGVAVEMVADLRASAGEEAASARAALASVPFRFATAPYEALAHGGGLYGAPLAAVRLCGFDAEAAVGAVTEPIACDLLVVSGGSAPMAQLAAHAGARLTPDPDRGFVISDLRSQIFLAGSVDGRRAPRSAAADGVYVGALAAKSALGPAPLAAAGTPHTGIGAPEAAPEHRPPATAMTAHPFPVVRHPNGKAFVDLDEDLVIEDVENAVEDGFSHPELLKRWSTLGMGPGQGRQTTLAGLRILARKRGMAPAELGPTTVRPPFTGERFQALAGESFHPHRTSPMHHRHEALGAQQMVAGLWHRPAWYGADREKSIDAEVAAVRGACGLIDVSTLGKLEVRGPDAARFLDRAYAGAHTAQPIGRCRYALLLDVGGNVGDDGVVARLADDHFYVTGTTGQADATYRMLVWLNANWGLDVDITAVTGAYAAVSLAGPKARRVLAAAGTDLDLSPANFPHLAVREGTVAGIPARLLRVGFVGELGWEIHVPADQGTALWDALVAAGAPHGIKPAGVEAQRILRLEKGHVIVGQDTDGLTHPDEAGLSWAVAKKKPFYWGKAAVDFRRTEGLRHTLFGFRLVDRSAPPPPESCLVVEEGRDVGRVTSAATSVACGGVVGLATLPADWPKAGRAFTIRLPDGSLAPAETIAMPAYDPEGARLEPEPAEASEATP
jgi:sarcosine oxidase subunit alpha